MFEARQELEMQIPKFPDNRLPACNVLQRPPSRERERERETLLYSQTRERIAIYEATLSRFKLDTDGKG